MFGMEQMVSISHNRGFKPSEGILVGGLDELRDSWIQLRHVWRLADACEDPLAAPSAAIASLERATRTILVGLLKCDDREAEGLFAAARTVRDKHVGTRIDMRAAIDVGNVCRVNCHYCPMRRDNLHLIAKDGRSAVSAYRADSDKMAEVADHAYQLGFR
ncbi:MAG TPA: hypothetical protein VGG11_16935, partial [Xanthobacteraceae bacterium]